ncbi:hypothetical protein KQI84_16360 [bacterium]|nr:hypothetical protein [bacterium]
MSAESNEGCVPHQLDVYFAEHPTIDPEALAEFVNKIDPDEPDQFAIEKVATSEGESALIDSYSGSLGDIVVTILVHSVPSPLKDAVIGSAPLPPPVQEELMAHKSFALISAHGGENYGQFELEILLWKIAMGLCDQEAIGVGSPWTRNCLPAKFLTDLAAVSKDGAAGDTGSIWKSLRESGEPRMLLAQYVGVEVGGRNWLATRGFAQCGFDDLVFEIPSNGERELEDVGEALDMIFAYQIINGPVIQAGHTIGGDAKTKAWRFEAPPEDVEWPFDTWGMLMELKRGEPTKKKRFFGLFG